MLKVQDRPTYLKIDLDNILENFNKLKSRQEDKSIVAVVKANSYGLGADVIAPYLYENGVKHFAVATLEEALQLRPFLGDSMILVLGATNPKNVKHAADNNISLCIHCSEWLEEAIEVLTGSNKILKVHLKLETGMNRIGVSEIKDIELIDSLLESKNVELEGIFSHYSNADAEDRSYDNLQFTKFKTLVSKVRSVSKYIHIENSAGTIRYQDDYSNMTRVGIALYGCYPSDEVKRLKEVELKTTASLISEVVHLKKVKKGEKIGYGCTYEAEKDEYIATIPIGYADGFLRRAQGFKVYVGDELCEIVGRICMDQLMVRCSASTKLGDKVLFFGNYNGNNIDVDDLANYENTISYEIFCCLGQRILRKYYINNQEVEIK